MIKFLRKGNKGLILLMLAILLTFGMLSGCASSKAQTTKAPTVKEIDDKIKKACDISNLKEADAAKLKKFYDIDSSELDEFVLYTAPSNIKADEIAILKVKDANNVSKIKDKVAKRLENQSTSFKDYLPNEYAIIQKNVLKTKGNYVLFIISNDAAKIDNAFEEAFK